MPRGDEVAGMDAVVGAEGEPLQLLEEREPQLIAEVLTRVTTVAA
jgi:hypothetical protein